MQRNTILQRGQGENIIIIILIIIVITILIIIVVIIVIIIFNNRLTVCMQVNESVDAIGDFLFL